LGADNEVFGVDFATSQIAFSHVRARRERGEFVPDDWVVDGSNSHGVFALKPLGGHKGQCLGMMIEILSSLLSGGAFGHVLKHLHTEPFTEPREISHFFLALDPAAFGDVETFRSRLTAYLAFIRNEPAVDSGSVMVPGDPERAVFSIRAQTGIPLSEPDRTCIQQLMREEAALIQSG